MEVPVLGARIGLDVDGLEHLESELVRRYLRRALAAWVTPATPRDKGASDLQQRRGVLRNHAERRERARCDQTEPGAVAPDLLRARVYDVGVLHARSLDRTLKEGTFAGAALDQRDPRSGQGDREWEARETGTRADVRDCHRRSYLWQFDRHQGIGEVVVADRLPVADGRGRQGILRDEPGESGELLARSVIQAEARRKPGGHSELSGRARSRAMKSA
ncbi:MAG TPA: hypothetical protein VGI87_10475 [Solirubrobacteraceae bacterium]